MSEPFFYDLGAFDLSHAGITLHFPTEADWQVRLEVAALYEFYFHGDDTEESSGHPPRDTSSEGSEPYPFMPEFRGITASQQVRERVGQDLLKNSGAKAFAQLAVATATEHERRHFHDWLLSPYTAEVVKRRSALLWNSIMLYWGLRAGETNVVPVPFGRWVQMTPEERQFTEESWQALFGDSLRVRTPDLTLKGLTSAVDKISDEYRSLDALFDQHPTLGMSASHVMEASSVLIQIQAIHDGFGDEASQYFANSIQDLGPSNRYATFLRAMSAFGTSGELSASHLSTIATWCLLGSPRVDPRLADPVSRFIAAYGVLRGRNVGGMSDDPQRLLDMLDGESGAVRYADALEASVEHGAAYVSDLTKRAEAAEHWRDTKRSVAAVQKYLHQCHEYMVRRFLAAPGDYCDPIGYLDRSFGMLPDPPTRFTFGAPFYRVPRSRLTDLESWTAFHDDGHADTVGLRELSAPSAPAVFAFDRNVASAWRRYSASMDAIFALSDRSSTDIAMEKERALAEEKIRYLELL